ncbi:hypothetical protein IWX90DRAFT_97054 [Phyllosticta citrichinensis]|uniref:Uncharacterized protein n=1 Tax=Phyllosticta citrichinensis TaxID=1130410 RepID=A0ABR1Y199_9PEZI
MSDGETIKIIWTCNRPSRKDERDNLMGAAYIAAMEVDSDVVEINIRAIPHKTTSFRGDYVSTVPHITISIKNPQQKVDRVFQTLHGNTDRVKPPYKITESVAKGRVTRDDTINDKTGYPIWNPDKLSEEVSRSKLAQLGRRSSSSRLAVPG